MDVVRVVVIRHIIILVAVNGSDWECAGGVRLKGALVLVCERRGAEHVAEHVVLIGFWYHMSLRWDVEVYFRRGLFVNNWLLLNLLTLLLPLGGSSDACPRSFHATFWRRR